MNTREISTVTKLLFLSFRLILATTQPSTQDSSSTMNVTITSSSRPQITRETVTPAVIQ